jgi:hypothetical protein
MVGEICFETLGKLTPGQHDSPATAFALQANVRAETDNGPFIGATGVLLAQAQVIVQAKIRKHIRYRFKTRWRGLYIDL